MNLDLMTVSEVARRVGRSAETVREWDRVGKLAALRTGGGVRIFRREDVDAFIKRREESQANVSSR